MSEPAVDERALLVQAMHRLHALRQRAPDSQLVTWDLLIQWLAELIDLTADETLSYPERMLRLVDICEAHWGGQ